MSTRLHQSCFRARRQRGVALLVTIILLVFLVLIMVAMSSMVRVETQIAGNTQSLAQARQNAMMGLNIAIGKLQETTGADQRATARADLVTPAASNQLNLTGVWDTTNSPPTLITWLVNGNEKHAAGNPDVKPDSANSVIPDARDLSTLSDPLYDDVNPAATAAAATPRFGDGHVYMVSDGSVDLKNGAGYKRAATERVILRKSPIEVDGVKVPGRAPGSMVVVGNYAFWVADDGIKASLSTGNRTGNVAYDDSGSDGMDYIPAANSASDASYIGRKKLNSIQLQAGRLDLVLRDFGANDLFNASAARREFYGALVHPVNFPLFNGISAGPQIDYSIFGPFNAANPPSLSIPPATANAVRNYQDDIHDRLKQAFHDITPQTYSVLADSAAGGLRADLSQPAILNGLPGVKAFVNVWRPSVRRAVPAANTPAGLLHHEITITHPVDPDEYAAGASSYPLLPVMSEFELLLEITSDGAGAVTFSPSGSLELWNPYNVDMDLAAGENLYVQIPLVSGGNELFSLIHVADGAASGGLASGDGSVARSFNWNGSDADYSVTLVVTPDTAGKWNPGETKLWTIGASSYGGPVLDSSGVQLTGFAPGQSVLQVATSADTSLTVNLAMGGSTATAARVSSSATLTLPATTAAAESHPVYYFRVRDERDNADWIAGLGRDPRSLTPDAGVYDLPVEINGTSTFDGDATSLLYNDSHGGAARFAVLFDVPLQEVISVGALRHIVQDNSQRPYRVGSEFGGNANNWFDRYYFSSVPRDTNTTWNPKNGDVLANSSIIVFDQSPHLATPAATLLNNLQSSNSSEWLLLRDSFNVNSTSVAAWRAMLGGVLPALANPAAGGANGNDYQWDALPVPDNEKISATWRYYNYNGAAEATINLRNAFFRFPQTGTNVRGNFAALTGNLASGTQKNREDASYTFGVRTLTDAQVDRLANNVVNLIKAHTSLPFASVGDFVNSGILQAAIDADATINAPGGAANPIVGGSPGFLSQGDIFELIGHRLVARSDTFTIRAYGDVINEVSGEVEARAWVEATVQRIPVKHGTAADSGNNMTNTGSGAGNFGRQFRILKLRWLDQNEI